MSIQLSGNRALYQLRQLSIAINLGNNKLAQPKKYDEIIKKKTFFLISYIELKISILW